MHKGSCLCGAIKFEVSVDLPPPSACHCRECRKHSGHYEASADVPRSAVTISGQKYIKWYNSSEKVRRGFCSHCGSTLFWDPRDQKKHDWTAIALGAFDTPTKTKIKNHIFTSEKGDYYEITDDLPKIPDPRAVQ
ncbi:MAG: GFA family protein [Pseudomonadota bacterium]